MGTKAGSGGEKDGSRQIPSGRRKDTVRFILSVPWWVVVSPRLSFVTHPSIHLHPSTLAAGHACHGRQEDLSHKASRIIMRK
jgi:hypothetical protein